jgi:hypothetical protein
MQKISGGTADVSKVFQSDGIGTKSVSWASSVAIGTLDCDGRFNRFDDIVERDLFGRTGKGKSAACNSLGFDKPAAHQILNDFSRNFFWYSLVFGNLVTA